jgi:hypothetical protein
MPHAIRRHAIQRYPADDANVADRGRRMDGIAGDAPLAYRRASWPLQWQDHHALIFFLVLRDTFLPQQDRCHRRKSFHGSVSKRG